MSRVSGVVLIVSMTALCSHAQIAPNGEAYEGEPFFDDFNGSSVNTAVWQIATWAEHGGQTGTERCFVKDGVLHLHFINDSQKGYLSSAIQTRQEFFYGRWEARLKPSSVPGVLNSLYTIDWDNTAQGGSTSDGTKQEIDIEFLTKSFGGGKGEVHLALHASGFTSWDTRPDIKLGFDPSAGFHVFGFDITPSYIEWFAGDSVVGRYEYGGSKPISITAPYQLKLNAWSSVNWIGGPPAAGVLCDYQIDWIRFTPRGSTAAAMPSAPRETTGELITWRQSNGIVCRLSARSAVTAVLRDAAGRKIETWRAVPSLNGECRFEFRNRPPSPGVYMLHIETAASVARAGRLVIY